MEGNYICIRDAIKRNEAKYIQDFPHIMDYNELDLT